MKKFIINLIYFSFFFIVLSISIVGFYFYRNKITINDLPALNFSDSYSFNEKIRFLKTKEKKETVIAIGSSMTQNNLHSKTTLANLDSRNYLNTSSWGMSLGDDFNLLKKLNSIYKIKQLIIVSNIIDFQQQDKHIDFKFVESYLKSDYFNIVVKFIQLFDLKYYKNNLTYAKKVRNCYRDYEYLNYDKYGAVNFQKDSFNIDKQRWLTDYLENSGFQVQYNYLDSISNYCKVNGIKLLFFQSPIRQGIWCDLDTSKLGNLNFHVKKVKHILEANNQIFINSSEKLWSDTLFVDAIHFNEIGAQQYTKFCFDKIKAHGGNNGYTQ